ncbi:hypothetical protein ACFR9U_20065 [Halorientalis brevis]|uniref:Uncharacterized protein n=1 Tax=Halorientalis brevis TaxID=1126241 RepID=A0ABD6CIZ6_9EURY|nr:hypothetical protein [Halorientalis brevis]
MAPTVSVTGDGISVEREVSEQTAPPIIQAAMSPGTSEHEEVTVNVSGEGMSFERVISEDVATDVIEMAIKNGHQTQEGSEEEGETSDTEEFDGLPNDFFSRLTDRQEAMIKVLLENKGWVLNGELRRQMGEQYDEAIESGPALSGVLAGLSRKHGKDFRNDLIEGSWTGDEVKFRLNRDYEEELREELDF